MQDLTQWAWMLHRKSGKVFDALDIFGASEQVTKVWKSHGFSSISYDLKLDEMHDLCSENGFFCLLRLGMQQLDAAGFCRNIFLYKIHCSVFGSFQLS